MPTRLDELFWELRARTDQLDRDIRQGQRKMRSAGEKSADEFLAGLEQRLARRQADINEALARRLISPAQARRMGIQAAQEFDAAILRRIEQLARSGRLTDQEFVRLAGSLKNVRDEADQAFNRLMSGIRTVLSGAGLFALINLVGHWAQRLRDAARAVIELVDRAGRVREIETAFENLSAVAGVNATRALEEMRDAADGTVSRFELMQRANLAFQARLPLTAERLGELVEISRRLGESVGRDATEAFTRLVNGIAKGEQNLLEELGILTRMEDALRAWEQQTGRNSDSLDQQQKILVFYNAVLDEARRKLDALGPQAESPRRSLDRLRALWVDLTDAITTALAESPRIAEFFRSMGGAAQSASERVEDIADRVGAFVDAFLELKASDFGLIGREIGFLAEAITLLGKAIAAVTRLGDLGPRFDQLMQDALARRQADRESRQLIQEIRASEDLATLQKLRAVTMEAIAAHQKEINRLREQGFKDTDREIRLELEEIERLQDQVAATDDRIRQLRERHDRGGGQPDEDTLKHRAALLERLRAQLAALTTTVVDDALLRLDELERKFREAFGGRIPEEARRGLARLRESIEVDRRLEERRRELAAFDVSVPTENVQRGLEEFIADLTAERDRLEEGSTARERYNELLREAGRLLGQVAKAVQETSQQERRRDDDNEEAERERIRRLREQAREIEQVARGVLQLADAFGVLDERARSALEAIVQIGANIPGALSGDPGSVLSVLGGVAQLIESLAGGGDEHARLLRENNERLEELARELRGMTITTDQLIQAQRALAEAERRDLLRSGLRTSRGTSLEVEQFLDLLRAFGLTISDIDRIAHDFGIEIRDNAGRLIPEALRQLLKALEQSVEAIVGFNESLEAQRERTDTEAELLDLPDTPQARLQRDLELLERFAPDLVHAFGLDRIDLSTAEGRARLNELINEIFRQFAAGTLSPELLGRLSRDEFLDFLRRLDESLDEISEEEAAALEEEQGFAVARGIKEIQANRLIAQGETHSILLGGILDEAAAIHDLFLRLIESTVQVQPPELPPFAPPRSITVQAPISQLIGTVEVQAVGGAVDEGSLRRAVQAAAFDLVEHIDRALERRRVAEQRARGR